MVMCALYNKIKIYSILFKEFRAKFMNFVFALYGRMEINSVLPLRRAQQSDVSVYFRALGSAQNKHGARHKMSVVYRVVFLKQIPDSPGDPLVSVENRGGGKHFFKQPAFETVMRTSEHYICLLYTSPSPRDTERSRMPSSA